MLCTWELRAGLNAWTPFGPEGGPVYGVTIDPANPSTVFAATLGGGFRSTDGGATWTRVLDVECPVFAIHPASSLVVFAANRAGEVWRSIDGGLTFELSNSGIFVPPTGSIFGRFAFKPGDPLVIYYAWSRGLFKSTDGGESWAPSDSGAVNLQAIAGIAVDPATPDVVYLALVNKGVYKSTNSGGSWDPANTGLPVSGVNVPIRAFAQDPSTPANLYAVSNVDSNLYTTANGGASWSVRSELALDRVSSLLVAPGDGLTIYAGGQDTTGAGATYRNVIFKSVDGGVHFAMVSNTTPPFPGVAVPLAAQGGVAPALWAAIGAGLAKSTDGGASWVAMNGGLRAFDASLPVSFSASSPATWYVNWSQGGVFGTTNGGASMSPANGNLVQAGNGAIAVDPTNPQILLAAGATKESLTDDQYAAYMVRSTNGGGTWSPVANPGLPSDYFFIQPWGFVSVPTSPTTFFVMTSTEGVFKSTDGGVNFVPANTGLPPRTPITIYENIAAADNSGTTMYVTSSRGLYKTVDGAASWNRLEAATFLSTRQALVSPLAPQRVLVIAGFELFRSLDSGATWNHLNVSFPNTPNLLALDPTSPSTIYAVGTGAPTGRNPWVYRSQDGGDTWNAVTNDGLDIIAAWSIAVDPANRNRLVLGGRGGLMEITLPLADCVTSITPGSASYGGAGGPGTITIAAPAGCSWTATAPAGSFVTITGGASGSGNGTVTYTVAPNGGAEGRTTILTVAGRSVEVTQNAGGLGPFPVSALGSPTFVTVSWPAVNGAVSYDVHRSSRGGAFIPIAEVVTTSHLDQTVSAGYGYLYRVHAKDEDGNVIAYSRLDLAVPFNYTDPTITAASTRVKLAHFTDLRLAANAARTAAGLSPIAFGAIAAGQTVQRPRLLEIRTAIDAARAAVGMTAPVYTDPSITAGATIIKRAHIMDLRTAVQ
ncbi:MAG TPA: hypothetical protein VEK57_20740 [Thermoanaerobaculia bacterium]|nr:hypothetical protein [Thermoanaerobaculia bacterium]